MSPKYIAVKKQATHWYDSVDDLYADERQPEEKKPTQVTMDNSYQSILPEHDLTLDETTGWEGVPPVSAIRYMGDHRAGSPVRQGHYQTSFEGVPVKGDGIDSLLPMSNPQPEIDFNAPTVEAPHGEPAPPGWKSRPPTDKDADHGYPDEGGWLYRDPENGAHYWYKSTPTGFQKYFMDVQPGVKGSWWSKATAHDFSRAESSASNPSKIVALRGDPNKYGIASQRDSDEALEHLAEMFLQHNENIPPEALVEIPLRENIVGERNENYMDAAHRVGIPMGHDPVHERPSRWSDKPLPFGPSRTKRKLEDVSDTELYRAEPMDIAFQLLKDRKSPEAWANKKRYDSQYQKNPKRVKYREQLNTERRRRGIYGKGGKDVSHTQGGKLTLESPHTNRARHFRNKGTLRRVKVK